MELKGFIYTLSGVKGYYILSLTISTLTTGVASTAYSNTVFWKIFQSRVDNHMYRPVWGTNNTFPSTISRITTYVS